MRKFLIFAAFLFLAPLAHAQVQYELACPSGSQPVNSGAGVTFNPSTGKYRANICVDSFGTITQNAGATLTNPVAANLTFTGVDTTCQLNGVLYVGIPGSTCWAGANVGAQLNSAYAALPSIGGVIVLFPGFYSYTTPIVFTTAQKPVRLECYGATIALPSASGACTLNYTPTTATTAITLDYFNGSGSGFEHNHGLINIDLINNGCITPGGCGSSASGIGIGGTNGGAGHATFRVRILGFNNGFDGTGGTSVSWGMTFDNSTFLFSSTGVNLGAGFEGVSFRNCVFANNSTQFVATGGDTYFFGGSIDGHTGTTGAVNLNWNGRSVPSIAEFHGVHWEKNNGAVGDQHYIVGAGNWKIFGGVLTVDSTTGNVDYYFHAGGAYAFIDGLQYLTAGQTVTSFIDTTGGAPRGYINVINWPGGTALALCTTGNCSGLSTRVINEDLSNAAASTSEANPVGLLEQAAPTGLAGSDICYGDSTAHAIKCSENNSAFFSTSFHSYSSAGVLQTGAPHIVQDTATLAAGTVTVTLTGSAVFTNATSYTCTADDDTAIAATKVLQNSGSSITITGTGTDVVRYICVGN